MDILDNELEVITGFDKEMREHALPIWFESLVGVDWAMLHIAPVYFGFGVPPGDGSAVIVVPGFLGSDFYLYELYLWLSRIGYTPYLSGIGWNADCLNTLNDKLVETIRRANDETGQKVHLIGHSLGGVLSRSAATQHPELVESVITLGSPFRGVRSHPKVIEMSEKIRQRIFRKSDKRDYPNCYTGHCHCATMTALHHFLPKKVRQTAIYTKSDGIVDWQNCRSRFESNNFEVSGTHIGLVYNFQVYKLIGERLKGDG
ncbi:MAG: alpha/beta hydrolase [Acidobacteria bacterium]|nr:alpha/beta hydrolase [Acidobacteriota bacterium]